jgi:hypothetical protein
MRGNLLLVEDGHIAYNCYNCSFKTVFDNANLSRNFSSLMQWLGIADEDIAKVRMQCMQNKIQGNSMSLLPEELGFIGDFKEVSLPDLARPIQAVAEDDDMNANFVQTIDYLSTRGSAVANGWDYHWSPVEKWGFHHRIIIPFYYKEKIVGWTARYAGKPPAGMPRYYNSQLQPGYLFNCDALNKKNRKYVILVEGPFDAIAIDGVAALGSTISKQQLSWLRSSGKDVIVLPDRQSTNQSLIDTALDEGWAVSFPDWEDDIKDAADASSRYGRLYTLRTTIESRTTSKIAIGVKRKMLQ